MKKITLLIILFAIINTAFAQSDEPDYLYFEIEAGTTIKFGKPKLLEYSLDKTNWQQLTSDGVTAENNCCVYFRGDNPNGLTTGSFTISKTAKCFGNVMTLIDKTGLKTTTPKSCFRDLFHNCPITTSPKLPAIKLKDYCYYGMFDGCTELIFPPELPAETLAPSCYSRMFRNCKSLSIAPQLPAMELAERCYASMFSGCSSLNIAPKLPAVSLPSGCYSSMFYDCTSLAKTPLLPAKEIDLHCYDFMFSGCSNLERTAPILFIDSPYLTDVYNSSTIYGVNGTICRGMFLNCNKLKYISVRFSIWRISNLYECITNTCDVKKYIETPVTKGWVEYVASTGTFVCPSDLIKQYGIDYIPKGLTVKTLEELNAFDITIPETTKPYITISETMEIESGSEVSFSLTDRTDEGYTATVTVQGTEEIETTKSGNDYTFTMPEEDVTISVTYTPITYSITTDDFSSADKTEASAGDKITVTISDRNGYNFVSAKYNGNDLTVSNKTAEFTMPAENVEITTTFTPIEYTITSDQYSTPSKTKANVGDEITVSFSQRDGYTLSSAKFNNTALTISNNAAKFTMPAGNVSITTTYTPIEYTITSDQYSTPNKTKANVGEEITVNFSQRSGYTLSSAKFNNTALTISNNAATFTMPAGNVSITATYTPIEYTVTAGEFVTANKTKANVGDEITVSFSQRDG
ncbi:MAG: hypothetical protein II937_17505, partial [Bacteroidales bacterium]|nr:hypothetical protein [Bacteroidales bacterium]